MRGQAAMEFLMTYGWALLVVGAAIVVLSYISLGDTKTSAMDSCILETGFHCRDFNAYEDSVHMLIMNSLNKDHEIINITVGNCTKVFNQMLNSQEEAVFIIDGCIFGPKGSSIKESVEIKYATESFTKSHKGKLVARIN